MILIKQVNFGTEAVVLTLAGTPPVKVPSFVCASIPSDAQAGFETTAIERLQAECGGNLTISRTVEEGRLLITFPCSQAKSLDDLLKVAETLRTAISNFLGVDACIAHCGYGQLCRCVDEAAVAVSLPRSAARKGVTVH